MKTMWPKKKKQWLGHFVDITDEIRENVFVCAWQMIRAIDK